MKAEILFQNEKLRIWRDHNTYLEESGTNGLGETVWREAHGYSLERALVALGMYEAPAAGLKQVWRFGTHERGVPWWRTFSRFEPGRRRRYPDRRCCQGGRRRCGSEVMSLERARAAILQMWEHRYDVSTRDLLVPVEVEPHFPGPVVVDLGQLAVAYSETWRGCRRWHGHSVRFIPSRVLSLVIVGQDRRVWICPVCAKKLPGDAGPRDDGLADG